MSSERRDALEAELALIQLEDALAAAKSDDDVDAAELFELKHAVRAARQEFRTVHRPSVPRAEGDAVAEARL